MDPYKYIFCDYSGCNEYHLYHWDVEVKKKLMSCLVGYAGQQFGLDRLESSDFECHAAVRAWSPSHSKWITDIST